MLKQFVVKEGVLSFVNVEQGESGKNAKEPSKNVEKHVSWSSLVQKNISSDKPQSANVTFTYNEDGTINLMPNNDFTEEGRKQ